MTSAWIYYRSRTGITKRLAENIAEIMKNKGIEVKSTAIPDKAEDLNAAEAAASDMVFLGCWTAGLFIFLQHPDRQWAVFADSLPSLAGKKVCLFTTYKLATGGLFNRMQKHLKAPQPADILILRSKNGAIGAEDKARLEQWIGN